LSNGLHDVYCKKCNVELLWIRPNAQLTHVGTDYWTLSGQRRWKPKICMACRTKVGRHAKEEQDKQIEKDNVKRLEQAMNNILQGL
jgi:hypothetical protein